MSRDQIRLDKTRKFDVVLKGKGAVRYMQDGRMFNCGGYLITGGVAQLPGTAAPAVQEAPPDPFQATNPPSAANEGDAKPAAEAPLFVCELCAKEFKTKGLLAAHMKRSHKDANLS